MGEKETLRGKIKAGERIRRDDFALKCFAMACGDKNIRRRLSGEMNSLRWRQDGAQGSVEDGSDDIIHGGLRFRLHL